MLCLCKRTSERRACTSAGASRGVRDRASAERRDELREPVVAYRHAEMTRGAARVGAHTLVVVGTSSLGCHLAVVRPGGRVELALLGTHVRRAASAGASYTELVIARRGLPVDISAFRDCSNQL